MQIRPSEGSKRGQVYHATDGTQIPNEGEKTINAVTDDGMEYSATYQMAKVTKPLNSIGKICDQDNVVVFTSQGGAVVNNTTGKETHFGREHGVYVMRSWIFNGSMDNTLSPFARPEK